MSFTANRSNHARHLVVENIQIIKNFQRLFNKWNPDKILLLILKFTRKLLKVIHVLKKPSTRQKTWKCWIYKGCHQREMVTENAKEISGELEYIQPYWISPSFFMSGMGCWQNIASPFLFMYIKKTHSRHLLHILCHIRNCPIWRHHIHYLRRESGNGMKRSRANKLSTAILQNTNLDKRCKQEKRG